MKTERTLAERWLWLGVAALATAGIFAIILVVARTPQLAALTVFQKLFSVALVVHVDLSVLMWFVALLGLGTALAMEKHHVKWPFWPQAAFLTIAAATACIALSPVEPHWEVIKSNYIPVLQNQMFLMGLALLAAGLVVLVIPMVVTLFTGGIRARDFNLVEIGWFTSLTTIVIALAAFFLSARLLPKGLPPEEMYEQLFWAGGHVLQFSFSLLMMATWVALLHALGAKLPSRPAVIGCYWLMLFGAVASFVGFALHPFDTGEFTMYQTRIMIELGGVGAALLVLLSVRELLRTNITRANRAYGSTLISSLVLFVAGSSLGVMITGQNVTIPAHYHGMIVGITLGLMGYAYSLLPRFGYQSVAHTRLAFWQPIVYGVGQLMHIGGLGYSGGYGVLRKTPGAIQDIGLNVKIALGVMGFGGMFAIIGGILFVIVMVRVRRVPSVSPQPSVL